ncbi:hypothetical protein EJP67_28815 [Variovorax guangxiensis]|uniref:YkgJ family cysteine cluster protein n=1 Tax=Variovorax guangxiensis TaxID=1775474 RepID=A0A3S0XIV6_9BURK|nr:YkgJ family cysteine cluster protein [Variovorax guangxiensis]RUR71063.1 hypothetical protein EJP67_28815 [Variovorax guangxiensis]
MNSAVNLPAPQRERLPIAQRRAEEKLSQIVPDPAALRLLNTARHASSARQRVIWLQRAASAWSKPLQTVAACRKGCDHCCHIPLTVTQVEAELIGKAIGRRPTPPATSVHLLELGDHAQDWKTAQTQLQASAPAGPCPFLVDHQCGIYEVRPLACRVLLNLDDDELLCQKVEGVEVPVPYANAMQLKAHYLALQPAGVLADIRAFFPPQHS